MDENEAFRLQELVDFSVLVGSFFAVEVSGLTFVNVFMISFASVSFFS